MADVTFRVFIDGNSAGFVRAGTDAERSIKRVSSAAGQAGSAGARGLGVMGSAAVDLSKEVGRVRTQFLSFAAAAGATVGIAAFARDIIKSSNALQGFKQGLAAATGSAQLAGDALGFVRAETQRLGTDLQGSAAAFTGLAAAVKGTSLEGQGAKDIFTAVSEAARVLNLTTDDTRGALLALQQMVSKGTVAAEELRGQLGERLPGAFNLAARAMGVTTSELGNMLKRGEVLAEDLLPKLAVELRNTFSAQAVIAANTPAAEMQRLKNAIFELEAAIGDAGFMKALASGARSLAQSLSNLIQSGSLETILSGLVAIGTAGAVVFGGRLLSGITAFAARQLEAAEVAFEVAGANRAAAASALEVATAQNVERVASLGVINVARAELVAKNQLIAAEVAQAEAALAAAAASGQGSFALKIQREATDRLTASKVRLSAITTELAALGRQQAAIQGLVATSAAQQIAAQGSLNAAMSRGGVVMQGLRTAGSRLFTLIGGWPTIALAAGFALFKLWDAATAREPELQSRIDRVRELTAELQKQARLNALVSSGQATPENVGVVSDIKGLVDEAIKLQSRLESLKVRFAELQEAGGRAVGGIAPEIGIVSSELRVFEGDILAAASALKKTGQLTPEIRAMVVQVGDLADAFASATGPSQRFARNVQEAFKPKSSAEFTKSLTEQVASLKAQRIELQQGLGARLEFEALNKTGAKSVEQLDQATRDLIATAVSEASALDAAKEAQKENTKEQKEGLKTAKELLKEADAFRAATQTLAAELAGPAAQANLEYARGLDEAAALFVQNAISAEDLTKKIELLSQVREGELAVIAAQRAPIEDMLDDLRFEASLIGLSNTQREIEIALRQIAADAQANGATLTQAEIDARKEQIALQITANAAQQESVEIAQQAAEDYRRAWESATDSVLRSFGDFVVRGANNFKTLGRQLKDIAKSFLADLVAMFLRNTLVLNVQAGGAAGGGIGGLLGGGLQNIGGALGAGGGGLLGSFGSGVSSTGINIQSLGIFKGIGASLQQGVGNLFSGNAQGALSGLGQLGSVVATALSAVNLLKGIAGGIGSALFGGKFKTSAIGSQFEIGAFGASGFSFEEQKKKGGLFGKNKSRTIESALDPDAQEAIDELFAGVSASVESAAAALAVSVPPLISGSFRSEFDKDGKLKKQFSTIAGKIVEESQEAFAQRLQAVNIIGVIDQALGTGDASAIAQRFSANAEQLLQGAQFLLAASVDLKNGFGLLGDGSLTDITALVTDVAKAGEPLIETYARLVTSSALLDQALKLQGQSLDLGREQFVRFAADIVDAAGGLDRAQTLWTDYFNRFFSDNERAATSLNAAQLAAQQQFGEIGLNASDFASAEGLAQFRALFEAALPTLAADAVVQWLEAAQAIGVVIDAQDALNQTLGEAGQQINQFADDLAQLMSGIRDQAQTASDALADFGLSPLAAGLQQVAREIERTITEAQRLGATESDLAEIRALGQAQAELLQRQAQAELADLLVGVNTALFELDASPLEIELARIAAAMAETLAQASALGATEDQLATIRELGARQSTIAIEAEVQRLRDVFDQLARAIGDARGAIAGDILNIRRTQPGFSEAAFQAGNIGALREQLAGATDPQAQIGLIDQIRQATVARYDAELADIQQTAQAQDQAAQAARQAIDAQRQALDRLRDFADGLGLSSNSPLTAFQRLDVARSQFDATLGRARSGDVEAISGLQQAAEALLSENRNVFGVSQTAVAEFDRVQAALRSVAGQGVRGAAASFSGFERASIDVSSQIAALQANAISELQGLDDTLAALAITTEAETEGTIQALRDRFDQAEAHTNTIVDHIQPIFDAINRQNETGDAQVAQLQQQTQQLATITTELQAGADINGAFLDKFLVFAQQQETTMTTLVERLGRAIERNAEAKVRA